MDLRLQFAANVRRIRRERGLSQEELAFEAGLHRTYISGIERGVRNAGIDNIGVIAVALGVEPTDLVALRPEPKAKRISKTST
jgi:transcriptional regulator with XRE-family HTH domain